MKVAILLACSALLGVCLAVGPEEQIQDPDVAGEHGVSAGAQKLVRELIQIYENMSKVPGEGSSAAESDTVSSIESVFGSNENGRDGELPTPMKEDIAQIEAVFEEAGATSCAGISGSQLWKALTREPKLLKKARAKLMQFLDTKQKKKKLNYTEKSHRTIVQNSAEQP